MNEFLYYSLMAILYVLFAFSLILIPYSIYKLKTRTSEYLCINKFFLFFGYFCLAGFYIIFIGVIHNTGINYQASDIAYFMIILFVDSLVGVALLWMWSHYEIHIQDDKFVYCKLFYGKSIIEYDQIDISNSRYIFVIPKGKRDFGHEVLKLKMKDGKEYALILTDLFQSGDMLLMLNTVIFKLKIEREGVYK